MTYILTLKRKPLSSRSLMVEALRRTSKSMDIGLGGTLDRAVLEPSRAEDFSTAILEWYEKYGRHYLWRLQKDPYKILVAEIMLQQTNADKVEPVYTEFINKFPDSRTLAQSDMQDLKEELKPLGLEYRVARLKNIAQKLVMEHDGKVPSTEEGLKALPGVGRYIANAVLCFAYSERMALVDVNVIRLYSRVFGIKSRTRRPRDDKEVWFFATEMLPQDNFKEYNLALLDFSARICKLKNPICTSCPVSGTCRWYSNCTLRETN